MKKTFILELTPLTPVHIGSGEELPGYAYYLDDYWYVYRMEWVLENLLPVQRDPIVATAMRDFKTLAAALQQHPDVLKDRADYVGGFSEGARQRWVEASRPASEQQALADRFIHSQNRTYIPGSTLKGALRNALLYGYQGPMDRQKSERNAREVEADTFGYDSRRLNTDPFRFLKIGDTEPLPGLTDLRLLQRYAYKQSEHRWEEQVETLVECTQASFSRLQRTDVEINLQATVSIEQAGLEAAAGWHGGQANGEEPFRLTMGNILATCRHFSQEHLAAEQNYMTGLSAAEDVYTTLAKHAESLPAHATLIRLGALTGRDSKTINYLQPSPETSVSRVLVDGVYPLGWVEMRVLTAEGEPFTDSDDIVWQGEVREPRLAARRESEGELARQRSRQAQEARAQREKEESKRAEKRREDLAGDILSFLKRKNDED